MISFDEYDERLDALVLPERSPRPPVIYHYTSAAGLEGILSTGEFWATHFRYTNDTTELRHAEDAVRKIVTATARRASVLGRRLLNRVLVEYEMKAFSRYFTSYLTCFSRDATLLSQWLRYADDGYGCAIGFDPGGTVSNDNACNPDVAIELFEVEYDIGVLEREFDGALTAMLSFLDEIGATTELADAFEGRFVSAVLRRAAYVCVRSKHEGFHQEKEWRLLAFPRTDATATVRQRDVRGIRTPYLCLRITSDKTALPITQVVVGPSCVAAGTSQAAMNNARELLQRLNPNGPACTFDYCQTPYRGVR